MNKKFIIKLITAFILTATIGISSEVASIKNVDAAYATSLEDGAVYFINSVANSSVRMDVPNASYTNGNNLIVYNNMGYGNQRFILKKQFLYDSSAQTYRLIPLNAQNKVLAIEGDSSSGGKKLQIQDENYSDAKLLSDKYVFSYIASHTSFRISTGASGYSKYLTLENYATTSSTKIVQQTYSSSYNLCFEWYLTKTDTLGLNVQHRAYTNGLTEIGFNLTIQRVGTYIIETSSYNSSTIDTYLTLKTTSNSILSQDDDSGDGTFSKISYYFGALGDYWVRLRGKTSGTSGYVNLQLRPEKEIYLNTIWDPVLQLDNVSSLLDTVSIWQAMGYYANVLANIDKTSIYEYGLNGNQHINNDYYIFWGHGAPGSVWYYDGPNSDDSNNLSAIELPTTLDNIHSSVWLTCSGAALDTFNSDYLTSMARETVVRGANASIGWRGDISKGGVWMVNYIEALSNGYTGKYAAHEAHESTKSDLMFFWLMNDIYQNDLWNPVVYYRDSLDNIVYSVANSNVDTICADDGGYLENQGRLNSSITKQQYNTMQTIKEETTEIDFHGSKYSIAKFGNIYSNLISTEIGFFDKSKIALSLIESYRNSMTYDGFRVAYVFENDGLIDYYLVMGEGEKERYVRMSDQKEISLSDFIFIANSNFYEKRT